MLYEWNIWQVSYLYSDHIFHCNGIDSSKAGRQGVDCTLSDSCQKSWFADTTRKILALRWFFYLDMGKRKHEDSKSSGSGKHIKIDVAKVDSTIEQPYLGNDRV